ncbi:unnamed protein product [Caenorhabditis brenneri]
MSSTAIQKKCPLRQGRVPSLLQNPDHGQDECCAKYCGSKSQFSLTTTKGSDAVQKFNCTSSLTLNRFLFFFNSEDMF